MAHLTATLCLSVFLSVLGSWQFGYHTGVLNAPQNIIEKFIAQAYKERNNADISVFGGLSGGKVADTFGRRNALMLNSLIITVGLIFMSISKLSSSYEFLIIGRLIIGYSCGLYTVLVPMFLTEISTKSYRGAIGAMNQLGVTLGLLNSQLLGIENFLGSSDKWEYLFVVAIIPALLQLAALPLCPESVRYSLSKNKDEKCKKDLYALRGNDTELINLELEEMRRELDSDKSMLKTSIIDLIKTEDLRSALVVGIVMQLSQQLSGINSVFYYSTSIFITAGLDEATAKLATVGVGLVMVVMTLITIPLMESLGRRTLHLGGLAGMLVCSIILTVSFQLESNLAWIKYMSVASALAYVVFFAVGPGTVPWLFISEIFTQGPRGAAMSVAVFVNWFANFTVGLTFPFMQKELGKLSFIPFAILLIVFLKYCYQKMPETKNRTFEEISSIFRQRSTNYGSA